MDFDTSMLIESIIPDSPRDFGALLFWVLMVILVSIVIIDIHTYLSYRKKPFNTEKPQQKPSTIQPAKPSTEERLSEIDEVRTKVDNIIKINNL